MWKIICSEVPSFGVQLIMAELSMQTPSECIPSQLSGASSELPLTGRDATLRLSQSPHVVLSSAIANDALAVFLLPPLVLSPPHSHSLACLPSLPLPHFLLPHRRHAFLNHSMENRGVSSASARGYTECYIIIASPLLSLFVMLSVPWVHAQHPVCKMKPGNLKWLLRLVGNVE